MGSKKSITRYVIEFYDANLEQTVRYLNNASWPTPEAAEIERQRVRDHAAISRPERSNFNVVKIECHATADL